MRLLMVEAQVHLAPYGQVPVPVPVTVSWAPRPDQPRPKGLPLSPVRKVISVVDQWRYDGRWWEAPELHRDYYLLELDNDSRLELFREGGSWWAARVSD